MKPRCICLAVINKSIPDVFPVSFDFFLKKTVRGASSASEIADPYDQIRDMADQDSGHDGFQTGGDRHVSEESHENRVADHNVENEFIHNAFFLLPGKRRLLIGGADG